MVGVMNKIAKAPYVLDKDNVAKGLTNTHVDDPCWAARR